MPGIPRSIAHFAHAMVFLLAVGIPASVPPLPSMDVSGMADDDLCRLRCRLDATSWWIQLGTRLYSPAMQPLEGGPVDPDIRHYYVAQGLTLPKSLAGNRVGSRHGYHILHLPVGYRSLRGEGSDQAQCRHHVHGRVYPVTSGFMAAVPVMEKNRDIKTGIGDPLVQQLVDQLDSSRFIRTIEDLVDFGSRNTTWSGSSVDAARDFIAGEFQSMGLVTSTPTFSVMGVGAFNVVGVLGGSTRPDEFLVVGAHYDSLPETGPAPGAEDNASGTAGVIELARVLVSAQPQRSIWFVAFSGEEQGLWGSQDFVDGFSPGEIAMFKGALIMDMISYTADTRLDVLLESQNFAAGLVNDLAQAAADFTSLTVFQSFNPFGSDHVPFLDDNLPAVLAIENDWDSYPGYHQSTDTVDQLTPEQGIEILRMNMAALARLANPDPVRTPVGPWLIYR